MLDAVLRHIEAQRSEVVSLQENLVALLALGPDNGGDGEDAKCSFVRDYIRGLGLHEHIEMPSPDPRVNSGSRPNLAVRIQGRSPRTLWVISHLDVVPAGDLSLWTTDPWRLHVDDDILIGRGVEDNNQAVVSSLLAAKALRELNVTPNLSYGMLFVADEETGSKHGLDFVLREHGERFGKDDLFLIPDFGEPDGSLLELAEKSMFWLKITVTGKQCHASVPHEGVNSLVAAAAFILKIRSLGECFDRVDPLFDPPRSTFEPTKKEANVENVNTVPGRDVFYVDCRVLAEYPLTQVFDAIRDMGREIERAYGVSVEYHVVQEEQAAPATSPDSDVARALSRAVFAETGKAPTPRGIGGGTVAAYLRRRGYEAAVWATLLHNAHQPGERARISNHLNDAKVIARMLLDDGQA